MMTIEIGLMAGGAALLIAAIVCAVLAWRHEGSLLAISETSSSTAAEILGLHRQALSGMGHFGRPVEISGVIECESSLISPRTSTPCVAFDYTTAQDYERGYRARGFGGAHQRRRYEIDYEGVGHDGRRVERFWVRDSSGRVLIDPAGAELDLKETDARYEIYTDGLGGEREAWHRERCLPVGHPVYVLGYLTNHNGEPLIARHPVDRGKRFLISHRDERSLLGQTRAGAYGLYLAGGLSGGLGLLLVLIGIL